MLDTLKARQRWVFLYLLQADNKSRVQLLAAPNRPLAQRCFMFGERLS